MTPNIIVDLDGTLALERHRRPLIRNGWREYFEHIHLDPVNDSVLALLYAFWGTHEIHILTSRPDIYIAETLAWLSRKDVPYTNLEMRPAHETNLEKGEWQSKQSDAAVKTAMLKRHSLTPENTLFVLEDRDEMVDFYRDLGYDCWQVHAQHELLKPD